MHATRDEKAGRQAGYSLIEVVISSGILITMIFIVTTLMISGSDAQKYSERLNRATEIAQDIVDEMREEVRSSVRVFENDTMGNAYLALTGTWTEAPAITGRLPEIDPNGVFGRDTTTDAKTGNELFFARHAWTDEFRVTSGNTYRVDVYRFVRYYMRIDGDGLEPGSGIGLNLCRWVSEPIVDGTQIDNIEDPTDQADFLLHLLNQTPDTAGDTHPKVELVWMLGGDPAASGTYRQIRTDGTLSLTPQSPRTSWEMQRAENHSSAGLLYYRHHSVATNYAQASQRIGIFGIIDNTGDGFPHGFEVQVVGPAAARQVLLRLVLSSTNRKGFKAHANIQAIVDCRDI